MAVRETQRLGHELVLLFVLWEMKSLRMELVE